MTNDVKLGTLDVATIKYGSAQVAKVMLGTTQVWANASPPAAPALVDFFSAVDTTYNNVTTHNITVPVGKTIPAGSLLVVACAVNGILLTGLSMADNANDPGSANTYARRSTDSWLQGTNAGGYLFVSLTTREIDAGEIITFTHTGASRNRHSAVVAWFSGTFPDTTVDGDVMWGSGNSAAWNTGTQSAGSANKTLDIAMTVGTGGTPPYTYGGSYAKIAEAVTASGTSDRGMSLGYRVSPAAGAKSASGTNTSAVWGAGLITINYS